MTLHDEATTALDTIADAHRFGHRCTNGQWHNARVGGAGPCPTLTAVNQLRSIVADLADRTHAAAHDPDAAMLVGAAAIGYPPSDVDLMPAEQRDGVRQMGREAIEELARFLDLPTRTDRAESAINRIRSTQ